MEEIVTYLEAIDGINHAERENDGSAVTGRMRRAYQAAETAWAALPSHVREKMSPPPVLPEGN